MKLKIIQFFKLNFYLFFLVLVISTLYSSCSLSGKIKKLSSQAGSDNTPSPDSSPVIGHNQLSFNSPTEYINQVNQSSYLISGQCDVTQSIVIEVNSNVVADNVSCSNNSFFTNLNLSSFSSGALSFRAYVSDDSEINSTVSIIKDTISPTISGNVTDLVFSSTSFEKIKLQWSAATDLHSGILRYEYAIGSGLGLIDLVNWTSIGNVTELEVTSLQLLRSTTYYASVRAVDAAGNISAIITNDGWWQQLQSKLSIDTMPTQVEPLQSFGSVVALSEDETTLVVGSPNASLDINNQNYLQNAGSVSVYVLSSGNWVLQQKFFAPIRTSNMEFGSAVAISGDTIVVGAPNDKFDENNSGTELVNAGAIYIYSRTSGVWTIQQKLTASTRLAGDSFGQKVDIYLNTIAVGAPYQDFDASESNSLNGAGAIYVFTKSSSIWSLQQKLVASDRTSDDYLGSSVSLNQDTIASGATGFGGNNGAIYIYLRTGSTWAQQQKIYPVISNARFGSSVDLDGDNLIVGSKAELDVSGTIGSVGYARVYTRSAGTWSLQQKLNPGIEHSYNLCGTSVAIKNDFAIMGCPGNSYDENEMNSLMSSSFSPNYHGAIYVFERAATTWSQIKKYIPPVRQDNLSLGIDLALGSNYIITGGPGNSYSINDITTESQVNKIGSIYSYQFISSDWSFHQKIVPINSTSDRLFVPSFEGPLAISEDGLTLAIGVPKDNFDANNLNSIANAGSVYIYIKHNNAWVFQQKITMPNRYLGAQFGKSVAISNSTLAVGHLGNSLDASEAGSSITAAGAVYVFTRSGAIWTQQQKLVASLRTENDTFGSVLDIENDTLIVGVPNQARDASDAGSDLSSAGAAYVFVRNAGVWSQQQKLVASLRQANTYFGTAVAISGETVVVTARLNATNEFDTTPTVSGSGAAYVFVRSAGVWTQQQKLIASTRNMSDNFGVSVDVDNDTIVVGANYQDFDDQDAGANLTNAGAAYIFVRSAGVWTQQQKITSSQRVAQDNFGQSVAIKGDTVVIGVPAQDFDEFDSGTSISSAGAIYVYKRSASTWTQSKKIVASGTNARQINDRFGSSVCIADRGGTLGIVMATVAPGQAYDSIGGSPSTDAGAAYIFD